MMPRNCVPAAVPGLPGACLHETHDMLTLALDATERPAGYSPGEREARSYMRAAMRRVRNLRAAQIGGAA